MLRFEQVAEKIKDNIECGVYEFDKFPAERKLAEQLGVSYMTIRRAVQVLVERRVLLRRSNRRLEIPSLNSPARKRIALLMPAYDSNVYRIWSFFIDQATKSCQAAMRPLTYVHWDDPMLVDAVNGFDGAFILPVPEPLSPSRAKRLRSCARLPVMLGEDYTTDGFPSVLLYPPSATQRILDHLEEQGHRRIACFNVQPDNVETETRIAQWRLWMSTRGYEGPLLDRRVHSYESPSRGAYRFMNDGRNALRRVTALYATTLTAVHGVYRALHEWNLVPGRDIAVATLDGEDLAEHLVPSLTSLEAPDPIPHLLLCLRWMASGESWRGPMALRVCESALCVRESTRMRVAPDSAGGAPSPDSGGAGRSENVRSVSRR